MPVRHSSPFPAVKTNGPQPPLRRLAGRVHQAEGPVRHQRDLIPGNRLLWPEILPIVVIRHHHAGVQRRVQPPLAGQPVAAHIVQLRRIFRRISPNILHFCVHFHPCHQLTVRRQVDRVQQHFCKLRTGDALLRLKTPIWVTVHPSRCNRGLYLLLGPMPLQIRQAFLAAHRRRQSSRHHQHRSQQAAQSSFPMFHSSHATFLIHFIF